MYEKKEKAEMLHKEMKKRKKKAKKKSLFDKLKMPKSPVGEWDGEIGEQKGY
jgi:hypothetical protein